MLRDVVIGTGKAPGDFAVSMMPMLKWLHRVLFRRDLFRRARRSTKRTDADHAAETPPARIE